MVKTTKIIRTLPWGEEIYLEIPLHKKSVNKFYARHGKTNDGREYIEFSKFGPKPNTDGENYAQKLRLYAPIQWAQIKHYVEGELFDSIRWDTKTAQKEFENSLVKNQEETKDKVGA